MAFGKGANMSHRHDDDEDNDDIDDDYGAQQQGASGGNLGLPYESASPPRSRCTQLNSSFSHPDICFHQFDPLLCIQSLLRHIFWSFLQH